MSDLHHFVLKDGVEELFSEQQLQRINDKRDEIRKNFLLGYWSEHDMEDVLRTMEQDGYHHSSECRQKLQSILRDPEKHHWTFRDGQTERKEAFHRNDILIVGGMIAADVLEPDEFLEHAGFTHVTDAHAVVGILASENRDLFLHGGGYTWDSVHDGEKYRSRISGSSHNDLRIERICTSYDSPIDPFGNYVHYKPITREDRETVCAGHSGEPTLLAAVLKYIDQERIEVDCLLDHGKELLAELSKKDVHPNALGFHPAGGMKSLFIDYPSPMRNGKEHGWYFELRKEVEGAYRIHIDQNRHLAFSGIQKNGRMRDKPDLTFPPEEMDHVVRGILTQAQQFRGRTPLSHLKSVLEYRFAEGFDAKMEEDRKKYFGE